MRGRKSAATVIFAGIFAVYAVYPYATLYRLHQAIRSGNAPLLTTLVDWPSVREGIKEDICDSVADNPEKVTASGSLPDFGASFIRGIAANAVDQQVTPEGLVAAVSRKPEPQHGGEMQVEWAFFDSPTTFTVSLHAAGQRDAIRLQMELKDAQWQVTRVWLPSDLLNQANSRT